MSSGDGSPARRLGNQLWLITIANIDFIRATRPLHNIRKGPTASGRSRSGADTHGYAITGYHELFSPGMAAVLE